MKAVFISLFLVFIVQVNAQTPEYISFDFYIGEDYYYAESNDYFYSVYKEEELMYSPVYAIADKEGYYWFKIDPLKESDEYCELWDLDGNWICLNTADFNEVVYDRPIVFSPNETGIYCDEYCQLINSYGKVFVESDTIIHMNEDNYILDASFETMPIGPLITEVLMGTSIYNPVSNESLDIQNLALLNWGDSLRLTVNIDDNSFGYLNTKDLSLSEFISYDELVLSENLQNRLGPVNIEYVDWKNPTSLMSNVLITQFPDFFLEPPSFDYYYDHFALLPLELEDNIINYRCYGDPGDFSEVEVILDGPSIYSACINHMECSFTGGPVECSDFVYPVNFTLSNDSFILLNKKTVFKDENSNVIIQKLETLFSRSDSHEYAMIKSGEIPDAFLLTENSIRFFLTSIDNKVNYEEGLTEVELPYSEIKDELSDFFLGLIQL